MRSSTRAAAVAALSLLVSAAAEASTLNYRIDIDADAGELHVSFDLDDYLYETCTVSLGSPAARAEDYFAYFDDIHFTDADGSPLEIRRSGPGVVEVIGIHGSVRGFYDVLVAEMNDVLGTGPRIPAVTADHAILPIESILGLPAEVTEKGLELKPFTLAFEGPDGWPLYAPWNTYGGRAELYTDYADEIRDAVVCMGKFDVRNEIDAPVPGLFILNGGDQTAQSAVQAKALDLVGFFQSVLGTPGKPVVFIGALTNGDESIARGYGRFLRFEMSEWMALAEPAEIVEGSKAYEFYLHFAHELFHHWVGVRGQLRPLSAESYWFAEGSADYFAAMALDRTGISRPNSFLDYLGRRAAELRDLPDRDLPIDANEATYESDKAYRRRLLVKSPLVCFLLETQIVTARKEGHNMASVLRRMFFSAFVRGQAGAGTNFSGADLAAQLNKVMGLRGQILLGNYTRGDAYLLLKEKATEVGLDWQEADDGTIHVTWAGPAEDAVLWKAFPVMGT